MRPRVPLPATQPIRLFQRQLGFELHVDFVRLPHEEVMVRLASSTFAYLARRDACFLEYGADLRFLLFLLFLFGDFLFGDFLFL